MSESQAVMRQEHAAPAELSSQEVIGQVQKIQQIMASVMKDGEHYGKIPGTDKPTLLKPGAEKLSFTFRLAPEYDVKETDLGHGHREYRVVCTLKKITDGSVWGQGLGLCSTMESKYRYRLGEAEDTGKLVPSKYWDERKKDAAKAQDLLGGKGFVTKKLDGIWHICKKSTDKVENPDLADTYNTVLKMAKKRAHVDATLTALACSDIFTQDLDDDMPAGTDQKGEAKAEEKAKAPEAPKGEPEGASRVLPSVDSWKERYTATTTMEAYNALEAELRASWEGYDGPEKTDLKRARDAAKTRLAEAQKLL